MSETQVKYGTEVSESDASKLGELISSRIPGAKVRDAKILGQFEFSSVYRVIYNAPFNGERVDISELIVGYKSYVDNEEGELVEFF